jgi:hypothetical protein
VLLRHVGPGALEGPVVDVHGLFEPAPVLARVLDGLEDLLDG